MVEGRACGDDVQIDPNIELSRRRTRSSWARTGRSGRRAPIVIGDNVWLSGGLTVGPGVTIGPNTVVGAGAVVVKDLPADVGAVGNPARVVRQLPPER